MQKCRDKRILISQKILPLASSSGFVFFGSAVAFNLSLCLSKRLACFLSVAVRSLLALTSPLGRI